MNGEKAYAILGLEHGVQTDVEELKRAYRTACIRWHPDKNPQSVEVAERKFKEVQAAFRHLTMLASGGQEAAIAAAATSTAS